MQDLKQDTSAISTFYLESIFLLLNNSNVSVSRAFLPSTGKATVSLSLPFSPPRYVVWVNTLWFLSLVISLTSALLASLLQRWARRYIKVTQPRYSPHKRARIRAFFAQGLERLHFPWAADAVPTLQHLSLFLFFVGLLLLLWNLNRTVFNAVVGWVVLATLLYAIITLLPIFRPDSPYYTPLSSLAWPLYGCIKHVFSDVLFNTGTGSCFDGDSDQSDAQVRKYLLGSVEMIANEAVSERSTEFDARILESTFDALGKDDTVEKFFEAIPGFLNSKLVEDLKKNFPSALRIKFREGLDGFLRRTLLSDSVIESTKIRRLVICLKATHVIYGDHAVSQLLYSILDESFGHVLQSTEAGDALERWCTSEVQSIAGAARCVVARILAGVPWRERNSRWVTLAATIFRFPELEHVPWEHISHDDSVLLSILIHCRQAIHPASWSPRILSSLSDLQVLNALPGLQHNFCALWNETVLKARDGRVSPFVEILRRIRHAYVALHQRTNAAPTAFSALTSDSDRILGNPSSYPLCNIDSHRPLPIPHAHAVTAGAARPSVPVSPTGPHLGLFRVPITPAPGPSEQPLSTSTPLTPSDLADVGLMQGITYVSISGSGNPNPIATSGDDLAPQGEKSQIATPSVLPTPVSIQGPNSSASSAVLLPSGDSTSSRTPHVSHTPGTMS